MGLPYVFANVTELDTPQLDANFNALGALTVIPCVATGTNTIALAPTANTPTVSAYANYSPIFAFVAAATTTGNATISVNGVGAKNVYKNNGQTQVGANDFLVNNLYMVSYNSALNSGGGGWVLINQGASAATAGAVQGAFKNLVCKWTSNTVVTITADAVAVSDGASNFTSLLSVSVTVNTALANGPGALDTGSLAPSTQYYLYVIYNANTLTKQAIMSTNSSLPSFTSAPGYTQWARVGSVLTDGSSHFIGFIQNGQDFQYQVGNNLSGLPVLASGSHGDPTVPTWVAEPLAGFVPPTAAKIKVVVLWNGTSVIVAPNNSYGANNSSTNPPPVQLTALSTVLITFVSEIVLESTNIYYASSSAGNKVFVLGFTDNLGG